MTTETSLDTILVKCLSQQLCEIELLKSMYPTNDIIFTDGQTIEDIEHYLSIQGKTEFAPNYIDFLLKLYVNKHKLEININLPSFYPNEEPSICIRCNQLNRQQETALNTELSMFLKTETQGEVCIYKAITWLQEYVEKLNLTTLDVTDCIKDKIGNLQENQKYCRLWIYSHHIYSKRKRDEIVSVARKFNLTGFCLPGKPGIVCVEGNEDDCKEWWRIIKSLSWKKIMIRKINTFDKSEQKEQQKFKNFEEVIFANAPSKQYRHHQKHTNMSEFSKFIEKYGLGTDFSDFFGLCNI